MIRDTASLTALQDIAIPCLASSTQQNGLETQQGDLTIPSPIVASIRFPFPKLKTSGFLFSGETESSHLPPAQNRTTRRPSKSTATVTRWKPPRDMVKLEDRLFCMLQPPLESLLQSSTIDFPFPG